MDRKRKAVLEQALRDMGNYGVKLRKPEELPDFDQPFLLATTLFLDRTVEKNPCYSPCHFVPQL